MSLYISKLDAQNLQFTPLTGGKSQIVGGSSYKIQAKLLILLERETGIEPATSSLGISVSIENKQLSRSRRSTQV
jgi:hypothetical protein